MQRESLIRIGYKEDSMKRQQAEEIKCRACGAPIFFIKSVNRKSIPVDAEPVWVRQEHGGDTYILRDGRFVFGRITGDADDDPDAEVVEAYVSHFATCTEPERFRSPRKKERKARAVRRTVF